MKNILENIIANDKSYAKSATRYLYKTHPELWENIVFVTKFLPNDAKPKQRIWHILNDKYEIERCPITNDPLKWNEKEYRKFSSVEVKNKAVGAIISKATTGNHWRQKDPDKSKKANEKFSSGFRSGEHKPWAERNRDIAEIQRKSKETWIQKYGVDNPFKVPEIKQRLNEIAKAKQKETRKTYPLSQLYYIAVREHTNKSWYEKFYEINGLGESRRNNDMHLDHIFSISEGFKQNIPPYIIGHWTNLRLIPKIENSSKGFRCHKTKDELLTDVFAYMDTGIIIRLNFT